MEQKKTKSAKTVGMLGIFLGILGVHNWCLNEKSKGIGHICLCFGGLLFLTVGVIISGNVTGDASTITPGSSSGTIIAMFLIILGALSMISSAVWGAVEGIKILTKGNQKNEAK